MTIERKKMEEYRCTSLVNEFWQIHKALHSNSGDSSLNDTPVLAQVAAILVLANVLKDRQEGK